MKWFICEDMAQLNFVTCYLFLQVAYLVLKPNIIVCPLLFLLLQVLLHLLQALLRSQKSFLVVLILCLQSFDLITIILVVRIFFGNLFATLSLMVIFSLEKFTVLLIFLFRNWSFWSIMNGCDDLFWCSFFELMIDMRRFFFGIFRFLVRTRKLLDSSFIVGFTDCFFLQSNAVL